jgi:hypothetical protein
MLLIVACGCSGQSVNIKRTGLKTRLLRVHAVKTERISCNENQYLTESGFYPR